MLAKILTLNEKNEVVPTVECYTEPYLKAVIEKYENFIPALCYLYYMTYPYSAYNNLPQDEKEKTILAVYPGEYSKYDDVIQIALKELEKRYETPQKRFFESQKNIFEICSAYYANITVDSINDDAQKGNLNVFRKSLLEAQKTAEAFRNLENDYEKEVLSRNRGGLESSYDDGNEGFD